MVRYEITTGDQYWGQIQKLLSEIHMTSTAPVAIGRFGASFNNGYPGILNEHLTCCAFDGNSLIGFCRGSVEKYHVGGIVKKWAYMGDHRVSSTFRGKGLAVALAEKLFEAFAERGIRGGFYYVNAGNTAQEKMMTRFQILHYHRQTEFVTSSVLLPVTQKIKDPQFVLVQNPQDCQCSWLSGQRTPEMSMECTPSQWREFVQRFPQIRFYADKASPDKIQFGLFDQSQFKNITMGHYPPTVKFARGLWNLATPITKAAKIPNIREPWKMADLCFMNPDFRLGKEALAFCKQEAFTQGCQILNYISEINGVSTVIGGRVGASYSIKTYLNTWSLKPDQIPVLTDIKPFVDLAFV